MDGVFPPRTDPVIVGFTGHRHLRDENKIASLLREVVGSLGREIGGEMIGRSSVASGADTLFAEACLEADLKWVALLPFPEADFKKDFDEGAWQRARALLDRAARIETLATVAERPAGYLRCGLVTVDGANLMIAVWDEKASRGPGGTADVVAHARTVQKPLILINPDSLEIARERFL